MGTWNLQGINEQGAVKTLIKELKQYKVDILAVQETHLKEVIGDANAKIGREDIYRGVTGAESKHQYTNDNGLRLINFAIEMKMKIMSTHFPRKEIYKGTWRIPKRNCSREI
ncbi:hypothetical protein QE152_g41042 [Popillia japonica]|uniref:Endonuclease/exonuclease/phosphatase domain-containing protein n=1 Tax=Popillia japonica TaxID=7064 RepID=A0AAW1H649_POPJA